METCQFADNLHSVANERLNVLRIYQITLLFVLARHLKPQTRWTNIHNAEVMDMNRMNHSAALVRIAATMIFTAALAACGGGAVTPQVATVNNTSGPADPLSFSSATYSVAQSTGSVTVTVTRVGTASAAVSVDFSTVDGTAVAGTDYTATTGTLQWAENDSTAKTITIPISNAAVFSGNKLFTVVLSNPSTEAQIADPDIATVTISGGAIVAEGAIQFSAATYSVSQSAGKVSVTVNRIGGSSGTISVAYNTSNGTAVSGTDYTAVNGTLDWADGDGSSKSFTVSVSNAKPFSGSKSFGIALHTPSGGAAMGSPTNATVTINGSSSASAGNLHLSASSYAVAQGSGSLTVTVDRAGGSSGVVSIAYKTTNGTAVAGTDYTAATGTLTWAAGDSAPKSFKFAISETTPFSGSKSFSVSLSAPSGGATISNPGTSTVTINGASSPPAGSVQLSAANYSVAQNGNSVSVTVNRVGGSSGAIAVSYATKNGTAVAGSDFTAASGTLNWSTGDESAKTFSVSVSNVTPFSGNKSFTVTLSAPTGGAALSAPSSAMVSIAGDAAAAAGSLQLSTSSDTVAQSAGTFTITVNRTGGSSGAVSVAYATNGGTAVSGTDFTAASGTLDWADGDAASKSFSVAISNAKPFSGNKSFTVTLSTPSGGATLSSPSTASVTISGTASSGPTANAPGAPTNFVLNSEGANSESMSWTAAAAGPAPISYYKIYRNGSSYATATGTSYTDSAATTATVPSTFAAPANIYSYEVSAVDANGNEGPMATNMTYWVYNNGNYFWEGDFSDVKLNYKDTAGAPASGTADISVTATVSNGYAQPYSGPTASPEWAADIGAFNYMIIDLKPTVANQTWRLNIISRLPQGDVFNNAPVLLPGKYGPAPVVGKWATYKVPLHPDLAVGTGSFVGSISGTTLTVTSVNPGMSVQTTAWLTGPGIPANTTINSFGTGNGGAGTYNLNKSATVPAGTTINMQRTNMYKFSVIDETGTQSNVYYMDNIGFTTN
jgi:hypothetical protein